MITAKEAKELTQKQVDTMNEEELVAIEEAIRKAISYGNFGLVGDGHLSSEVVKALRQLGYQVNNNSTRNELYHVVDWGNK